MNIFFEKNKGFSVSLNTKLFSLNLYIQDENEMTVSVLLAGFTHACVS